MGQGQTIRDNCLSHLEMAEGRAVGPNALFGMQDHCSMCIYRDQEYGWDQVAISATTVLGWARAGQFLSKATVHGNLGQELVERGQKYNIQSRLSDQNARWSIYGAFRGVFEGEKVWET